MAGHHLPQRLTLPISITATYSVLNLTFYFPLLDKPWSQVSPPSPMHTPRYVSSFFIAQRVPSSHPMLVDFSLEVLIYINSSVLTFCCFMIYTCMSSSPSLSTSIDRISFSTCRSVRPTSMATIAERNSSVEMTPSRFSSMSRMLSINLF